MVSYYGCVSHPTSKSGGRRPGPTRTREEILAAAQHGFAENGYAQTTIRSIARAANVDPSLVLQFFGSKDNLFNAALRTDSPASVLADLAAEGDLTDLGARLTTRYLELWEGPHTGPRMLAVVRAAAASPSASAMVAAFMTDAVMLPLARSLDVDRAELRANLVGAYLFGIATARYVLAVQPLASLPREIVVTFLSPTVQHQLTGDLGNSPS